MRKISYRKRSRPFNWVTKPFEVPMKNGRGSFMKTLYFIFNKLIGRRVFAQQPTVTGFALFASNFTILPKRFICSLFSYHYYVWAVLLFSNQSSISIASFKLFGYMIAEYEQKLSVTNRSKTELIRNLTTLLTYVTCCFRRTLGNRIFMNRQ